MKKINPSDDYSFPFKGSACEELCNIKKVYIGSIACQECEHCKVRSIKNNTIKCEHINIARTLKNPNDMEKYISMALHRLSMLYRRHGIKDHHERARAKVNSVYGKGWREVLKLNQIQK